MVGVGLPWVAAPTAALPTARLFRQLRCAYTATPCFAAPTVRAELSCSKAWGLCFPPPTPKARLYHFAPVHSSVGRRPSLCETPQCGRSAQSAEVALWGQTHTLDMSVGDRHHRSLTPTRARHHLKTTIFNNYHNLLIHTTLPLKRTR
jgi:hypothetical protein